MHHLSNAAVVTGAAYWYAVRAQNQAGSGDTSTPLSVNVPNFDIAIISGKVTKVDGTPLAGVKVVMENGIYTITDQHGDFLLNASVGAHTLSFSVEGYEKVERQVALSAEGISLGAVIIAPLQQGMLLVVVFAVVAVASISIFLWRRGKK